jgi:hypothetical protein
MVRKLLGRVLSTVIKPKVYIDHYNGIASHFETLTMAFAIQKTFGHPIVLGWKELDAFHVEGTTRGRVRTLAKLGAIRLRGHCSLEAFQGLGDKKIICRCEDGPGEILDPIYREIADKIKLRRHLAEGIRAAFDRFKNRPIVGVHIRRGDFSLAGDSLYDPTVVEYPAVPLWWYKAVMNALVKKHGDVKFFISATGSLASYDDLLRNFDVFHLEIPTPYTWKGPGHQSDIHPVADLFALACCRTILATPVSGYAHWAANVLGDPSLSLIPMKGATPALPRTGILSMYGQRMSTWRNICRGTYEGDFIKEFSFDNPPQCLPASTEWLSSSSDRS